MGMKDMVKCKVLLYSHISHTKMQISFACNLALQGNTGVYPKVYPIILIIVMTMMVKSS